MKLWCCVGGSITRLNNLALVLRGSKSNEGLTFVTSASESLCAGEFTLSTQLIEPNYLVDCEEFGTPRMLIKLIE